MPGFEVWESPGGMIWEGADQEEAILTALQHRRRGIVIEVAEIYNMIGDLRPRRIAHIDSRNIRNDVAERLGDSWHQVMWQRGRQSVPDKRSEPEKLARLQKRLRDEVLRRQYEERRLQRDPWRVSMINPRESWSQSSEVYSCEWTGEPFWSQERIQRFLHLLNVDLREEEAHNAHA